MNQNDTHPDVGRDPVGRTVRLLWPHAVIERVRGRSGHAIARTQELVVLPTWDRPRLLLPASPGLARAATAAFSGGRAGLARRLIEQSIGLAAAAILPTDRVRAEPSADETSSRKDLLCHVASHLPVAPTFLAVRLGSDRPNQKPVVVFGTDEGDVVAFAKLGWNPLTRRLVAAEARALRRLVEPRRLEVVRVPEIRLHEPWQDARVLVMEALPRHVRPSVSRTARRARLVAAMRDIAGATHHSSLGDWVAERLMPRVQAMESTARDVVLDALDRVVGRLGRLDVEIGAWHGDFRPWNLVVETDEVRVWDWERFGAERLVGMDAVHFHFPVPPATSTVSRDWLAACEVAAAKSVRLLAALGQNSHHARVIRIAHAVELLLREDEDGMIQPDVRRPHQQHALLALLHRLAELPA